MAVPTKTTRLEAVNRMLATIGVTRVTSLPQADRLDVIEASETLDEVTKEVLKDGWEFNTDWEYPFEPDGSNEIPIPADVIQIEVPFSRHQKVVSQRDGKFYDKTNRTHEFTQTIEADVVWFQDFETLPEAARWYILVRAARQFADRMLAGQESIRNFTERDELRARAGLIEAEGEAGQFNIFQHYDTYRIIDRRTSGTGENWWL